jgi:hypothetical protein
MKMHMVVAINMVERKTSTPEGLKLSPDFPLQLLPHPRTEEEIDPGPEKMGRKSPSLVYQIRYGLGT